MLNPSTTGLIVVCATFIGSLSGMVIRRYLPDHHLETDSKDTIKLAIGLIADVVAQHQFGMGGSADDGVVVGQPRVLRVIIRKGLVQACIAGQSDVGLQRNSSSDRLP